MMSSGRYLVWRNWAYFKMTSPASIIAYLELTRENFMEALAKLEDDRSPEANLADILGATRYRFYHGGRIVHVKCPQTYFHSTDTFLHNLTCYKLGDGVCKEALAVPSLVNMTRRANIPGRTRRVPYLGKLAGETHRRDAAPSIMVGAARRPEEITWRDTEGGRSELRAAALAASPAPPVQWRR